MFEMRVLNSSTCSHASEDENHTSSHSKSCKCKQALIKYDNLNMFITLGFKLCQNSYCQVYTVHSHLVRPLINSGPNGYEDMIKMEYVILDVVL
jgi:hypothetical protein